MRLLELVVRRGDAGPDAVGRIPRLSASAAGQGAWFACKDTRPSSANRTAPCGTKVATARGRSTSGSPSEEGRQARRGKHIGFPQTGNLRPARPGRHRTSAAPSPPRSSPLSLPATPTARCTATSRWSPAMIERGLTGAKGKERLLPHGGQGPVEEHAGDRLEDPASTGPTREGRTRQPRRGQERRQGEQRPAGAGRAPAAGGQFAWRHLSRLSPRSLRWCRRSPTTWPASTRRYARATAGSNGPFELIDRLGPGIPGAAASPPTGGGATAAHRRRRTAPSIASSGGKLQQRLA